MNNQGKLKNKAVSSFIWSLSEKLAAKIVGLVITIILARLLDPAHYSIISIAGIFLTFCDVFIEGGFNSALIQKKDITDDDYSTVFIYSFLCSVILYAVLFFTAPLFASLYDEELLIPVIRILSLRLIVSALYSVESAYISRTMQFRKFFLATIGGTIVSAIIGIYMAYKGFGVWALVAQHLINTFIDTAVLSIISGLKFKLVFSFERFKELFEFGGKILLASVISTVYSEIRPLIVGIKYDNEDLAFYAKGNTYPAMFNGVLQKPLTNVLFPVLSKVQTDIENVLNVLRRFIKCTSFVIFPMMMGLFAIADNFTLVLLTEKWMPIVPFMRIFCIVYMIDIINLGAVQSVKALGQGSLILKMEITKKSIYFIIIACFVLVSKSPLLIAISCIICNLFGAFINTFITRKLLSYDYKRQIMDLLPSLTAACGMCLITWLVGKLEINIYFLLIIQMVVGAISYILLSYMFNRETVKYSIGLLKGLRRI